MAPTGSTSRQTAADLWRAKLLPDAMSAFSLMAGRTTLCHRWGSGARKPVPVTLNQSALFFPVAGKNAADQVWVLARRAREFERRLIKPR